MKEQTEIDFVITWVDGNDPEWKKEFNKYSSDTKNIDIGEEKYRDWENLHYWFRGVEKFAPWARKIHFITWGHLPKWLNKEHPKLNIVYHSDYIEKKYLPVFNARPIELCLHKIKDLSERFIFFNDDMFVINKINPSYFFRKNLPRDVAILDVIRGEERGYLDLNNINIINKHFKKRKSINNNFLKWFNIKYGFYNLRNAALFAWPDFTGFFNPHLPQPYLKQIFCEVWRSEREQLEQTESFKFREKYLSVNHFLFRNWQIAKGAFHPNRIRKKSFVMVKPNNYIEISKNIQKQKFRIICMNDHSSINKANFEVIKNTIKEAFNKILPNKSSFEK